MSVSERIDRSGSPLAIVILAVIAGLTILQLLLHLLSGNASRVCSLVLATLAPIPGIRAPSFLSMGADLIGMAVCGYLVYGLLTLKRFAWRLAIGCAILIIGCKLISQLVWMWTFFIRKNIPAVWRDAPGVEAMTSLSNIPGMLLPFLARLLLYGVVALVLFRERGVFGDGVSKITGGVLS